MEENMKQERIDRMTESETVERLSHIDFKSFINDGLTLWSSHQLFYEKRQNLLFDEDLNPTITLKFWKRITGLFSSFIDYKFERMCIITDMDSKFYEHYLLPTLTNLYNKIVNYKINFYDEDPFKDGFDISFISYYKDEICTINNIIDKLYIKCLKFYKNMEFEIKYSDCDNSTIIKFNDISNFSKDYSKILFNLIVVELLVKTFAKNYVHRIKYSDTNTILHKLLIDINTFHIGNYISLTSFSKQIIDKLESIIKFNICVFDFNFLFEDKEIFFENDTKICNKDYIVTKEIEFISPISSLINQIGAISHPSKHKSLDTFIPDEELKTYEDDIKSEYATILYKISDFKSKYLLDGYKDIELFQILSKFISEKTRYVYINPRTRYVYINPRIEDIPGRFYISINNSDNNDVHGRLTKKEIDNNAFSFKENLSQLFEENGMKEKYGDNYNMMLDDSVDFVNFVIEHILVNFVEKFNKFVNYVLCYNEHKLFYNANTEMSYDEVYELKRYFNPYVYGHVSKNDSLSNSIFNNFELFDKMDY